MNKLKIQVNFGSMAGISAFAVFLAIYFLGKNPLGAASWLGSWVPVVFIPLGVRKIRDEVYDGYIKYWSAVGAGFVIGFFYASLFALSLYLFATLVDPAVVERHLKELAFEMEQVRTIFPKNVGDQLEEQIAKATVASVAFDDFRAKVMGGVLVSLLAAAFIKRPVPPPEEIE